jgi:uncharacterized protein
MLIVLASSRVTSTPAPVRQFDCQICGACCVSPYSGGAYVSLDDREAARMLVAHLPVILQRQGGDPPEFLPKLGTKPSGNGMKACAAFQGNAGSTCSCSIYEGRPSVCRQFEAGSHACRDARRLIGVEAGL